MSFFSSSEASAIKIGDFLQSDIHSHLIPSIDDGAKSVEESMTLIKGLINLGYKKIFTTPHIRAEMYPNNLKTIQTGFERVNQEITIEKLEVDFFFGAEYFLDFEFLTSYKSQKLLSFSNRYLLLETSLFSSFNDLEGVLFELKARGYKPILAHPERYLYLTDTKWIERLKSNDYLMQVNLLSFAGGYGKTAKLMAYKLLDSNLIDFLGTDLHNAKGLKAINNFGVDHKLLKYLEKDSFLNNKL